MSIKFISESCCKRCAKAWNVWKNYYFDNRTLQKRTCYRTLTSFVKWGFYDFYQPALKEMMVRPKTSFNQNRSIETTQSTLISGTICCCFENYCNRFHSDSTTTTPSFWDSFGVYIVVIIITITVLSVLASTGYLLWRNVFGIEC